jgi:UDP-3-O-[3-hydroxymyristoyl] glucosamine N-acyltransferase
MNAKYLRQAALSGAGALIVGEGASLAGRNLLISDAPYWAFARILNLFYPDPEPCQRIHPTTVVGERFVCRGNLFTEASVVIGDGVRMGEGCRIGAGSVIGDGCVLGDFCHIYPNVTLYPGTVLGSRVRIHSASVLGSDGFGFAPRAGRWEKIPHLGTVEIGDDVEIGAGCTIDRGTFGITRIGHGVKLDDQVHIAHNVSIGDHTLLVAKVGISGHIRIGDGVRVGPMSGVAQNVADGQVVSGSPEMPHGLWLRVQRILPRLPEMRRRIQALERRLGMEDKDAEKGSVT